MATNLPVKSTILLKNTPEILAVLNKLWDPRGKHQNRTDY